MPKTALIGNTFNILRPAGGAPEQVVVKAGTTFAQLTAFNAELEQEGYVLEVNGEGANSPNAQRTLASIVAEMNTKGMVIHLLSDDHDGPPAASQTIPNKAVVSVARDYVGGQQTLTA